MMGTGKSSVGRALGDRLGLRFVDTDDIVTSRMGCSIAELFGSQGEQAFRDMEMAAINEVAGESSKVVATGGGVVLAPENVRTMRDSGLVVWLQADAETLWQRIGNSARRPLLQNEDPLTTLKELLTTRTPIYESAAHVTVATGKLELEIVVDRIEELWNAF